LDLPTRTDTFVGRASELSSIEKALDSKITGRKGIVLHGISGSGKTQLALEYISKHYTHFSGVLWIDARSPDTLQQSFSRCGYRILNKTGRSVSKTHHIDFQFVVLSWLRDPMNRNWLMVVDSLDDLDQDDTIIRFCRELSSGSFIVSSTLSSAAKACDLKAIDVSSIDLEAAKELLLLRAFGSPKTGGDTEQQERGEHR
jgi:hypothetical protein